MHLVTLGPAGHSAPGVIAGNDILDLRACAEAIPSTRLLPGSVQGILEGGDEALALLRRVQGQALEGRQGLVDRLLETGALVPRGTAKLLAPIPQPGQIFSCGMNYHGHLKEMNTPTPKQPTGFFKSVMAVTGPGAPIVLPRGHADMVDWEGEFSAVIGKPCHNVSEADALKYVAGYTLVNDVSARDWVAAVFKSEGIMGAIHAWDHNLLGKQYPTFCPLGPAVATADEIRNPDDVQITTSLNGKVMQSANTDDLVFSIPKLIAYYSQFYLFRPGDVITTGSPAGVGYGRNPRVFMKAGDTIEVKVGAIGTLSNPVQAPRDG